MCTLSGFSKSDAILANTLFVEIPMFTVNLSSLCTRSFISCARCSAFFLICPSLSPAVSSVTSRKHSSTDICCRTGEYSRNKAMSSRLRARYKPKSLLTTIRSGHSRKASTTGWAVRIPSFFAGIDAAVTIPRRCLTSPPTIAGTVRKSTAVRPSCLALFSSSTALQERNAELTSM